MTETFSRLEKKKRLIRLKKHIMFLSEKNKNKSISKYIIMRLQNTKNKEQILKETNYKRLLILRKMRE